ncbi:MAG TPA: dipeptidase [Kofleriaceae bacterium]|nr:dipeptidase [Kofleriaceae bacterium]
MRYALPLLTMLAISTAAGADDLHERATKLTRDAIIVDTHLDAPEALIEKWRDVAEKGATDHFDIPRAKAGGLTAPFFSIYVDPSYAEKGGAARALALIDLTRRVIADHPSDMVAAASVDDIRAAKKAGKIGVLMGIEGGHAIENSLPVLREMYRAGVRYMTLTHVNTNDWADSAGNFMIGEYDPKPFIKHHGLNDFGREVVKEMNRVGMIVDISHVSDETLEDVLEVSRAPVMASHSSCRALSSMPRNLSDDQIKRIAAKGGVVMINIGSQFLSQKNWDAFVAMKKKLAPDVAKLKKKAGKDPDAFYSGLVALYAKNPPPRATLSDVADHIEHVIKVAGIDAVGLGTDFDGIPDPAVGFDDYSKLPDLVAELLKRGHSDAEVKKILGENFLAFFARVEAAKKSLASEKPSMATLKPAKK